MTKLVEIERNEYETFVKNNNKSHFLQSYIWGQFSKKKKNLAPYYLGLKTNDTLVGTVLLLKKSLPFGYSYFYAPRGYIIDFSNKKLVKKMTEEIIKFIKPHKAIFFKIDPDVIRSSSNYLEQDLKIDNNDIFENITSCGFKHLGFTKNFETMQPRYTFRIDLNQDIDTIYDHFSKTTKQRINKASKLGCNVSIGTINDIDTFCHLMTLTENRKDFVSYNNDYYKELYEMFKKEDMATLFLGSIDTDIILKNLKSEKKELKNTLDNHDKNSTSKSAKNKIVTLNNQIEKIEKEIDKYTKYQKEYGKNIILNAHMIITYANKSWVLYAGNHNILSESYCNYLTYFVHIKYCKEKNIQIYDQFGTIGDLSKNNPRLGLHEFKKKFGGDYIEFVGEFDYIINPFMYFVFTKLVPLYRNLIRRKKKREVNNEVKRNK